MSTLAKSPGTATRTATPITSTIEETAMCANCRQELTRTRYLDRVFAWLAEDARLSARCGVRLGECVLGSG